jgi:methylmalonyl-CoA mutase
MATSAQKIPTAQAGAAQCPLRFITASSLFDGHDASINIIRRLLQASGVEVIHLAHNRSVQEVVQAALQEDVQAVAVSSYQGGHCEYFRYLVDQLRANDAAHIKIFGGGGGVIVASEIKALQDYGVSRIYAPADGQQLGLQGIIDDMQARCRAGPRPLLPGQQDQLKQRDHRSLARAISAIENGTSAADTRQPQPAPQIYPGDTGTPVLGITGTGGAGKSSLTDEIVQRFMRDSDGSLRIAVLAIDPTRRKTGGSLLGDRIRMNAIYHPHIFMRSLATRAARNEVPPYLNDIIQVIKLCGFDLIIVETPGIGQGDTGIVPYVDVSLYLMTPEYGAASQLEKIAMLDYADVIAINKFDRRGAADALRDVSKQVQRNRQLFSRSPDEMPVYGTIASRFNDDGITALYQQLLHRLWAGGLQPFERRIPEVKLRASTSRSVIIPPHRQRYLAEIAETISAYHHTVDRQAGVVRERQQLQAVRAMLEQHGNDNHALQGLIEQREQQMDPWVRCLLETWPEVKQRYSGDALTVTMRDREINIGLYQDSLSGTRIPRVVLPGYNDQGDLLRWLMLENIPGQFPFTAGVFPFRHQGEAPTRMFAGEGDALRTNRRFKKLSEHSEAKRLSTAFDSVTLYGFDPDERPDIYGKVGNAGVSIATLDDMRTLYQGFDLCDPKTSVSMTINGPAPAVLAMFLNTAIDQQVEKFSLEHGREPGTAEYEAIRAWTLEQVRGTVQADILKEDMGQNTCIFSTEFSLRMMGDIQQYFIDNQVRNFYSVSISGYHIAEAGANPITQLAFTLANGFTYVEAWLARGMQVDEFAPNLSFFFSSGMDPEFTVLGRVARRIWAITMRDKYGAAERSQKLKYHIQTSGRSLHAREMTFNDIRTTLQALIAIYDNCNSLHTNAYDEAITTPTEASVRQALAIQLIINQEWGLAKNENPVQGAFIIEHLTRLVEQAVLEEFERIAERGGVLGAMETGYQRGRIQDESIQYEHMKHDGSLPVVGVNTFINAARDEAVDMELARSTDTEKRSQISRVREFKQRNKEHSAQALERLQQAVINNDNVFAELMHTVRYCTLGQITQACFTVGGQYRRNM